MRYCTLILLLAFAFPLRMLGQAKEYKLKGQIQVKGGETNDYRIVFTVSGSSLKGYSITTLQDGLEIKVSIAGSINKKLRTLSFKESDMSSTTMFATCMLDAALSYQQKGNRYFLKGRFTGNKNDNYCFEGTMTFDAAKDLDKLFDVANNEIAADGKGNTSVNGNSPSANGKHEDGTTGKPLHEDPSFGDKKLANKYKIITADEEEVIDFDSDTCYMDIWDGEYIDGDIVTLVYNGKVQLADYSLVRNKKHIVLPLTNQVNTLTIIAENEGKVPPNTSQITLYDKKVRRGLTASISKGQGAVIILRKNQ